MNRQTIRRLRSALAMAAAIADAMACTDSTPPNDGPAGITASVVGRYAVVSVDANTLPGFVSASVNNPVFGYDSAWMQADTLLLRADSVATEAAVFSYKQAGAGPTAARVGVEADSIRGRFTVSDGRLIIRTWMDIDDTVAVLNGGMALRRAVIVWNYRPTRPKPLLTYQRLQ